MVLLKVNYIENLGNRFFEVFANDAPIGDLKELDNRLCWSPYNMARSIRFQFRNDSTFFDVVNALYAFKNEKGYRYLVVTCNDNGFVAQLGEKLIRKAGFVNLPNEDPNLYFLE